MITARPCFPFFLSPHVLTGLGGQGSPVTCGGIVTPHYSSPRCLVTTLRRYGNDKTESLSRRWENCTEPHGAACAHLSVCVCVCGAYGVRCMGRLWAVMRGEFLSCCVMFIHPHGDGGFPNNGDEAEGQRAMPDHQKNVYSWLKSWPEGKEIWKGEKSSHHASMMVCHQIFPTGSSLFNLDVFKKYISTAKSTSFQFLEAFPPSAVQ